MFILIGSFLALMLCGVPVAVAMAGQVPAFTPRRVGRPVEAGRACATLESGKRSEERRGG